MIASALSVGDDSCLQSMRDDSLPQINEGWWPAPNLCRMAGCPPPPPQSNMLMSVKSKSNMLMTAKSKCYQADTKYGENIQISTYLMGAGCHLPLIGGREITPNWFGEGYHPSSIGGRLSSNTTAGPSFIKAFRTHFCLKNVLGHF